MIDPDNAGLQGALSSIRNGAEFGIRVNVAVLPRNTGDPDELRCARRLEVITTAIEKAFSPGEFLARFYVRESEKGNAYNCRLAINTYRAMLVPDRIQFTSMCADLGVEVMPELDAVKAMGNLMDSGATILEAAAFIKRKFKVAITVESVNE
jgi:hypothetical protein